MDSPKVHAILRAQQEKTGRCQECGRTDRVTVWAFQKHPEPHTLDPDDYREQCRSCHGKLDALMLRIRTGKPRYRRPKKIRKATKERPPRVPRTPVLTSEKNGGTMRRMKWRDERAVQEALEAVTTAPDTALDEAILRAAYAGAEFREIASAAGMSLNMTYRRARRFRDKETA